MIKEIKSFDDKIKGGDGKGEGKLGGKKQRCLRNRENKVETDTHLH